MERGKISINTVENNILSPLSSVKRKSFFTLLTGEVEVSKFYSSETTTHYYRIRPNNFRLLILQERNGVHGLYLFRDLVVSESGHGPVSARTATDKTEC